MLRNFQPGRSNLISHLLSLRGVFKLFNIHLNFTMMGLSIILICGLVTSMHAALISKDCSQIGSGTFYTNPNSVLGTSTCSPSKCTMVTNAAAIPPTPTNLECSASLGTMQGGLAQGTSCSTYSYNFTKSDVFKNFAGKTCSGGADKSAVDYPDVCSRAALNSNFMLGASSTDGKGHLESGIRLVYCNDQYLVVHTANVQNHPSGLADNPHPPGSDPSQDYDAQSVTRYNMAMYSVYKIPLKPRDLGTSAVTNNMDRFSETFVAKATAASTTDAITFEFEDSGKVHSGYVVTGSGIPDKTVLSSCDSAEIIGGTGGASSQTLTISWTIFGTVCAGSNTTSSCSSSNGKYVYITSSLTTAIQLSACTIVGGAGTCTMASSQTIPDGSTLYVRSSEDKKVRCILSEKTTTSLTAISVSGSHSGISDLPAYTSTADNYSKYFPGLPIYGPAAIAVTGQVLYPVYDDKGYTSQEMCEVDMCNAHAGIGYDYHYHGDPYHHTPGKCMYSPKDYTDPVYGHPPLIGFGLDGFKVYGRHLNETNIGYTVDLDDCGGHKHGTGKFSVYHYHAQVKELSTLSQSIFAKLTSTGTSYYAPIPGVFKCWRGDIGTSRLFGAQGNSMPILTLRPDFEDMKPCTGQTHFWRHKALINAESNILSALNSAFTNFVAGETAGSPTPAPTPVSGVTVDIITSSVFTVTEITNTPALMTSIKAAVAVMLELDTSAVTSVNVVAASRRKEEAVDSYHETATTSTPIEKHDWRELQTHDESRILGYGLFLDARSGTVKSTLRAGVDKDNAVINRKMSTYNIKITATLSSAYTASTAATAVASSLSIFTSAFSYSAISAGYQISSAPNPAPTLSPTKAPTSASSSSSSTSIIIGVVVGVGGGLLICGIGAYLYMQQASKAANSPMPVESSHHEPATLSLERGEAEMAMALTHGEGAGVDTWQDHQAADGVELQFTGHASEQQHQRRASAHHTA